MANLLSLPLELLVYITSFVSTPDLAALRLTCKQTEKSLYEWFSEEFFVKKQFMLTQPSLQVLLDISRHRSLSKKLKHLIIATNVYDDIPLRFRDGDACNSYLQGYADQQALISNGIDREMLTEAFKGLRNLETVDIRDFSAKRERDGDGTLWNSWGATTVYKETGVRLRESYRGTGSQSRYLSHVFSNLLYSLGIAGRTPPRFEVLLRQQPGGLPDSSFHLANFMFPAVQPVLQNLRVLFLTLNLNDMSAVTHHTHSGGVPVVLASGRSLRHFLSCTPNLTHLRLNFQKFSIKENRDFIEWLAVTPTSGTVAPSSARVTTEHPPAVNLPRLTALEFGQLDIHKETLLAVLTKFAPKLERLSLWRMTINNAGPPGPYDAKPNIWSQFFRALAAVPELELNYFMVGALSQSEIRQDAQFKTEVDGEEKSETKREYSGKQMRKFIGGLAQDVVVNWPPEIDMNSDASNSDEDEDMYDNEDDEDDEAGDSEDEDEDEDDDDE